MLKVQELLRTHTEEEYLKYFSDNFICYREEEYKGQTYIHLDYDIFASKTNEIAKECRGLGLIKNENFDIFRFGFIRFMNYGENGQDNIDFNKELIYEEKCDGSIIFLNYLNGEWIAGTRGRLFPSDKLACGLNFSELFFKYFGHLRLNCLNHRYQYIFEICTNENRVVLKYDKPTIVLLGKRDINWVESDNDYLDKAAGILGVSRPEYYVFNNISECKKYLESSENFEGFVVKQYSSELNRYLRLKIKSLNYIHLHNIISSRSLPNLVRMVIDNKRTMFLDELFVDFLDAYDKIYSVMRDFVVKAEIFYYENEEYLHISKKEFALKVKDSVYGTYCFMKLKNQHEQYFQRMTTKNIIRNFDLSKIVGKGWVIIEEDEDV